MSLPQTHADTPTVRPAAPSPARSLVATVAKAIAEAGAHRRFGCYDYSKYPGDDAPYVVRDEIARREMFRSWDHDATQAEYKRLTEEWVAIKALEAIHNWSHP